MVPLPHRVRPSTTTEPRSLCHPTLSPSTRALRLGHRATPETPEGPSTPGFRRSKDSCGVQDLRSHCVSSTRVEVLAPSRSFHPLCTPRRSRRGRNLRHRDDGPLPSEDASGDDDKPCFPGRSDRGGFRAMCTKITPITDYLQMAVKVSSTTTTTSS